MNYEEEIKRIKADAKRQHEMILALNNQVLLLKNEITYLQNELIKKERSIRSEIRLIAKK